MGTRYYIHVGDTTTSAGLVLTGLATHLWHGHQCSFEGDQVFCRTCKSVGFIRCIGDRIPSTGRHGREQALSDDLCICRCPIPPRLVASQVTYSTSGNSDGGSVDLSTLATAPFQYGLPPTREADKYDQRFCVVEESTGEPIKERRYKLTYRGGEMLGRTDGHGYTERVSGNAGDSIEIEVLAEGA